MGQNQSVGREDILERTANVPQDLATAIKISAVFGKQLTEKSQQHRADPAILRFYSTLPNVAENSTRSHHCFCFFKRVQRGAEEQRRSGRKRQGRLTALSKFSELLHPSEFQNSFS